MTGHVPGPPAQSAFHRRFGGAHPRIAAPLAILVAVVLWVAAAGVGGRDAERASTAGGRPSGSGPTAQETASSRPAPRSSAAERPRVHLFGPPLEGDVLVRGATVRRIDLRSGEVSGPIGPGPAEWASRLLRMADGSFVCVCATISGTSDATRLEVRVARIAADGRMQAGTVIGSWVGSRDPLVPTEEDPDPVSLEAARAPVGRLVAISVTVRHPPVRERSVMLVDATTGTVLDEIELPPVASHDAGERPSPVASPASALPIWASAPTLRFAPDGRHLLVSAVVAGPGSVIEQRAWVAAVTDDRFGAVRELPAGAFGAEACSDGSPEFADASIVFAICSKELLEAPFVRRTRLDGAILDDLPLRDALGPSVAAFRVVDPRAGTAWLWDPWMWRAVRVDLRAGRIDAVATVPGRPEAGVGVDAAFVAIADWIAPPAAAKILLEPALAISPDGSRLYVLGVTDGRTHDRPGRVRVIVLDARSLEVVATWEDEPDVISIGVAEDGQTVRLLHAPIWDDAGTVIEDGWLSVHEARDGSVRAIYGQLGGDAMTLLRPATLGG